MKIVLLTLFTVALCDAFSQQGIVSTRDSLKYCSSKLMNKALVKKKIKKLVICNFTDQRRQPTKVGGIVSSHIAAYMTNIDSVEVLDRQDIDNIIKEHKLKDKDFLIDENAQLQLGKFSGAEALVVGKVTVYETECSMQIDLKVVETNTAQILSAVNEDIPIDKKFADVSGLSMNCLNGFANEKQRAGKGHTKFIESNEQYNNAEKLKNNGCEEKNQGDYCFFNGTTQSLTIYVYNSPVEDKDHNWQYAGYQQLVLKPEESKCIYNLDAGKSFRLFVMLTSELSVKDKTPDYFDQNTIQAVKCESKTYTIRNMVTNESKKSINKFGQKVIKTGLNKLIKLAEKKLKIESDDE